MAYEVSEEDLERQRLLEKVNGPSLDRLIDSLTIPRETKCLDLGCGIGEGTRHLARELGMTSEVVGVDIDPVLVKVAEETPSRRHARIRYQQGDANALLFEDQSFDLVYARSLLQHMEKPERVLSEMLRVCKSGGIVALQEGNVAWQYCYPRSWAYERIGDVWGKLLKNAFIGQKLWSLFQQAGYPSVNLSVDCRLETEANDLKRFYRLCHEATRPALMRAGLMGEEEFDRMLEEFKRVEQATNVLCVGFHFFTGWVIRR